MLARNRAYLLTEARRHYHAAHCAPLRPRADAELAGTPQTAPEPPQTSSEGPPGGNGRSRPETALVDAGPEGVSVSELEAACGMGRSWVYYRLQAHATAGRAAQVRWATGARPGPLTRIHG